MTEERRLALPAGVVGTPPRGGLDAVAERLAARDPRAHLEAVQASAKGWHTAQIAILGLLGVTGVSRDATQVAALPLEVQVAMLIAALASFSFAAGGALLIARVAWPLYRLQVNGLADDPTSTAAAVERAQRRMRRGVTLTVLALIAMGAVFALSWWPLAAA